MHCFHQSLTFGSQLNDKENLAVAKLLLTGGTLQVE